MGGVSGKRGGISFLNMRAGLPSYDKIGHLTGVVDLIFAT
jgi:hypothetical protein